MDPNYLKNIRVLVTEDDEDDWLITKRIFSQIANSPFVVDWAPTYGDAVKAIDEDSYDVYLLDYRLGEKTGTQILEYARPESRRQPFILMTGTSDKTVEAKSLKLAAADYLVKGSFDATLLSRTLLYAMQRKYLEQQRIDQLVELNQAKEDFISIASHQLRTPATGVKQYLGMLIEGFAGDIPKSQLELLENAYRNNERQLKIINDLLKVAQVDSGKLRLQNGVVNIYELVEEVVEELRATIKERGQKLTLDADKKTLSSLKLECDVDAVRMVIENIIDNASKYSSENSTISVEVTSADNAVCIAIRDKGVGITEEDLPRLFEKFVRFDNSLSTKVGGSGLGLYWAKRIIDLHGGRIDYEPNRSKGSIFTITLPKSTKTVKKITH